MKKATLVCFALIFALLLFSPALAGTHEGDKGREPVFLLPSSLRIVDEEAFYGTAVETVVFPEGFLRIGDQAFGGAAGLTAVYIPETTEFIADSAFAGARRLTVYGAAGSYAEQWAYGRGVPFVIDHTRNPAVRNGRQPNTRLGPAVLRIAAIAPIILFAFLSLGYYEGKSRRPQDRPELNPIDYRFP